MAEKNDKPQIQTSLMVKGRKTVWHLQQMKDRGEKIVQVCPANWDSNWTMWCDQAGVDIVRYTCPGENVEDRGNNLIWWTRMIRQHAPFVHLNAVAQTQKVVEPHAALAYCSMLLADGADSINIMDVKNDMVSYLADNNVSLFCHVGALSGWQTAKYGGYKRLGQTAEEAFKIYRWAYEYQECGMKAMTIELTPIEVADAIAKKLTIPVIGVAAGAACDGSELVIYDMMNMMPNPGVHAKIYGDLPKFATGVFSAFADDVRSGAYPQPINGYAMDPVELEKFMDMLDKDIH